MLEVLFDELLFGDFTFGDSLLGLLETGVKYLRDL
jgi:hypothetical protein